MHVTGDDENGFFVFDVWESEAAVEEFRAAIESIPTSVGIEEPPRFFPVHTFLAAEGVGGRRPGPEDAG